MSTQRGRQLPFVFIALALAASVFPGTTVRADAGPTLKAGDTIDVTACAWPIFVDGRKSGFGFNDRNAYYAGTMFNTAVKGGHWRFEGEYPKARWMSFESYDHLLQSQAYITGDKIDADKGSNPFAVGGSHRPGSTYHVDLVNTPPAERDDDAHNVLYGGWRMNKDYGGYMRTGIQSVLYRVYAAPDEIPTNGGVDVPRVSWVVDDPTENELTTSAEACQSIKSADTEYQPWTTIVKGLESINEPFIKPVVVPAAQYAQLQLDPTNPPRVHVFRPSTNGYSTPALWFNSATPYVALLTNKVVGPVLTVRFKVPTFARIEDGQKRTGNEQVSYWDWCSTQYLTPLNYTIACRRDEQFTVDKDGYATLVISTEDQRPVVNGKPYPDWIPMAGNGGISVMRMLDSSPKTFPNSAMFLPQNTVGDTDVPVDLAPGFIAGQQIKTQMGAYYPQATYCTKAAFEKDRCRTAAPALLGLGDLTGSLYDDVIDHVTGLLPFFKG